MASKSNLAKIHIAKKELCLTDDAYRDILRRITGKESAGVISDMQAVNVLQHFAGLGWKVASQGSLPGMAVPLDPQSKKIQALWITLHKAGVVNNGSDAALLTFVKRVVRRDRLEWCSVSDKNRVIEALKDWGNRKGVAFE